MKDIHSFSIILTAKSSLHASIILNSYLGEESINLNPTRLRNAFEERETENAVTVLKECPYA